MWCKGNLFPQKPTAGKITAQPHQDRTTEILINVVTFPMSQQPKPFSHLDSHGEIYEWERGWEGGDGAADAYTQLLPSMKVLVGRVEQQKSWHQPCNF